MTGIGSTSESSRRGAISALNFEASPSNPTSRQVVVDIPLGVDLLKDFSMASQLFKSLLGPEEKARLMQHHLDNSVIKIITSILQSHLFANATQKKTSDQMDKLMAYTNNVERLKFEAGLLQAEVSALQSMNAGLQNDNETLYRTRNSLAQLLQEIQQEQEEQRVQFSVLTKANKDLERESLLKEDKCANLYSINDVLEEKVSRLEDDLASVCELRDKDQIDKVRLEDKLKTSRVRRNTDKYVAELDRNWVALKARLDTIHEIQDGDLDLSLAVTEVEAATNAAREALEKVLSENEDDDSESEDAPDT